ncbi:MAG: transketolase C-terminal domain-containing protein, partial [Candidatus Omnitrophota bacterium]|nr:transketolase C-terminal domain-containing protein [Candidatus Omnitrophota bacterium]
PAENEPVRFHGASAFDINTGASIAQKKSGGQKSYTGVFSEKLVALAKENKKIVAITAAMPEGTGLDKFRDAYPERFFDVGIAEAHALCFAAGMSREGLRPIVAVYSTFLQRAYDQLVEDVALQGLAVVFAIDRAGIAGEDGVTHQGIFDISFLRSVPDLVIMAPKDGLELEEMLEFAFKLDTAVALRYPKSPSPVARGSFGRLELGRAEELTDGKDFAIVALGSMVIPSFEAVDLLRKEDLSGTLINARFVKPLDAGLFKSLAERFKFIFSAEEGIIDGGFGSALGEVINRPVVKIGLPCSFIAHGAREVLLEKYGLTSEGIAQRIKSVMLKV